MQRSIEQQRVIVQQAIRFFDREYAVVTVSRDRLKGVFAISIYIPKTNREIATEISDAPHIASNHPQFLEKWMKEV